MRSQCTFTLASSAAPWARRTATSDTSSAVTSHPCVWTTIREHRSTLGPDGLAARRADQRWDFTWARVRDDMESRLHRSPELAIVRDDVRARQDPSVAAADKIIAALGADFTGALGS